MIKRLLIANRGEIAVRIARTARRLGIETVAMYSAADRDAMHVWACDRNEALAGVSAAESYLDIEQVIAAAQRSGADAVHPGYGFLSERADFADACVKAQLTFVGPTPLAMRQMGSKIEAKRLAQAAGLPVITGYSASQDDAELKQAALDIGFPVLIKAAGGGGGRGMRIVRTAAEFDDALVAARREAGSAFGDTSVFIEHYLERARHVEVQVFADHHGQVVHLFERDCSLQRRYQKVIEEAPAPALGATLREQLWLHSVKLAQSIGYRGAGTVEFLVSADRFHFIEMNTRLQVEHPVTEMITGLDLVEWQLRVAAGEHLPLTQGEIRSRGHAIEARVYAERPRAHFLPSMGRIERFFAPDFVRVDTGIRTGDVVSTHYDPMLAKIISVASDRDSAARQLARALDETLLDGVDTNLGYLSGCVRHPEFLAAELHTGFLAVHEQSLIAEAAPWPWPVVLAALARLDEVEDGFRVNLTATHRFRWQVGAQVADVELEHLPGGCRVRVNADSLNVVSHRRFDDGRITAIAEDGQRFDARLRKLCGQGFALRICADDCLILPVDEQARSGALVAQQDGLIKSPLPGSVLNLAVRPGDAVEANQLLVIVEAMKMEHRLLAPMRGQVQSVRVAVGDRVKEGDELLVISAQTPSVAARSQSQS